MGELGGLLSIFTHLKQAYLTTNRNFREISCCAMSEPIDEKVELKGERARHYR